MSEKGIFCCFRSEKIKAGQPDGRICGACIHVVDGACTVQARIDEEQRRARGNGLARAPFRLTWGFERGERIEL